MTEPSKRIYILAGPNGAGKTTFAREYLPVEARCLTFINADLIALGLSPFRPEQAALRAGRLMLELIEQHVERGESFAFETTLAGRSFARSIPIWREQGYAVTIYYFALPAVEYALERVAIRVQQGGHDVPEDVVRRRFVASHRNFEEIYKPLVDRWLLVDNLGEEPVLIESGTNS
jgi:predicted ABC-type ATPase